MAYPSGQIYPAFPTSTLPNYERPADWLSLPRLDKTEEMVVGLYPVFNVVGNFIALVCEGDYTVDWGDGTVEDFASGVAAQHNYDYAAISNTTLCSRGYKQVVVTITPQVGQQLTYLSLGVHPDEVNYLWGAPWLDLSVSMPNIPSVSSYSALYLQSLKLIETISLYSVGQLRDLDLFYACYSLKTVYFTELPYVEDLYQAFNMCVGLKFVTIPELPIADFSDASYTFGYCYSLESVTFAGLPSATTLENLFNTDYNYTYSLTSATILETPLVSNFGSVFDSSYSLRQACVPDMSGATYAYSMFSRSGIPSVYIPSTPILDFVEYMFYGSYFLNSAEFSDLSALSQANNWFDSSYSLQNLTIPETPVLQFAAEAFYENYNLKNFPLSNVSSLEDGGGLAAYTPIPNSDQNILEFPSLTNGNSMLYDSIGGLVHIALDSPCDCGFLVGYSYSLQSFSIVDASQITSTTHMFSACGMLSKISMPGLVVDLSVAGCLLSRDAMVDLFNDLGNASATITVTGNYGAADLTGPDIAIATDKGWTVLT